MKENKTKHPMVQTKDGGSFFSSFSSSDQSSKMPAQLLHFFPRFSDSAGKGLQRVSEEAPLTVATAGQRLATKATSQLPWGIPLLLTQIKGLLMPRASSVMMPAGVRPRQVFGLAQVCWGMHSCSFNFFQFYPPICGEKEERKGSRPPG